MHGLRDVPQVCPQGVYKIEDRKAVIQDKDWCMECGACAAIVPYQRLESDRDGLCLRNPGRQIERHRALLRLKYQVTTLSISRSA